PVALVHDLEPAARRRVLVGLEAAYQVLHDRDELAAARVVGRDDVEDLDGGHAEPADRPAPVLGGEPGGVVRPGLVARLVVGVFHQAVRLLEVAGVDGELVGGDVPGRVTVGRAGRRVASPFGQERHGHEDAVGPELPDPAGAGGVPETAD